MKLNYEFTENEFLALKKDYAFNSKLFKRYKFMGTLILPLVLLVMIIFQFIIGELDIPL
jgi:hypothetical protein